MAEKNTYRPSGSIPPILTPAEEVNGHINLDDGSFIKLIDHIIEGGSDAVFGLGTSGEFREQTEEQKMHTISVLSKGIANRIPMLIGISANSMQETTRIAHYAQEQGAAAVVLTPLYGEGEIEDKLTVVKEATGLPIILYNNPAIQNNLSLPIEFIQLHSMDPRIVGLKDSSYDDSYKEQIIKLQTPEFHVLEGVTSHMYSSLTKRNVDGVVNWMANPYPREVKDVFLRKDQASMDSLLKLGEGLSSISAIKTRLVNLGIIKSAVLFP